MQKSGTPGPTLPIPDLKHKGGNKEDEKRS